MTLQPKLFTDQHHFNKWCHQLLTLGREISYFFSQKTTEGYLKLIERTLELGTRAGLTQESTHYAELLEESYDCCSWLILWSKSGGPEQPSTGFGKFEPVGQNRYAAQQVKVARALCDLRQHSDDPQIRLNDDVRLLKALKANGDRQEVYEQWRKVSPVLTAEQLRKNGLLDGPDSVDVQRQLFLIDDGRKEQLSAVIDAGQWLAEAVAPTEQAAAYAEAAIQAAKDGYLVVALTNWTKAWKEVQFSNPKDNQLLSQSDAPFAALVLLRIANLIPYISEGTKFDKPILLLLKARYLLEKAGLNHRGRIMGPLMDSIRRHSSEA